jgi:hypothetical protein
MEHLFTHQIKAVLEKHFAKNANDIFEKSLLIQYINEKTRYKITIIRIII